MVRLEGFVILEAVVQPRGTDFAVHRILVFRGFAAQQGSEGLSLHPEGNFETHQLQEGGHHVYLLGERVRVDARLDRPRPRDEERHVEQALQ